MAQRVVMCSPLTLFAFLGVIRQAFDNFMIEQTSDEILKLIGRFGQQWQKYSDSADKVKRHFDSVQREFDQPHRHPPPGARAPAAAARGAARRAQPARRRRAVRRSRPAESSRRDPDDGRDDRPTWPTCGSSAPDRRPRRARSRERPAGQNPGHDEVLMTQPAFDFGDELDDAANPTYTVSELADAVNRPCVADSATGCGCAARSRAGTSAAATPTSRCATTRPDARRWSGCSSSPRPATGCVRCSPSTDSGSPTG